MLLLSVLSLFWLESNAQLQSGYPTSGTFSLSNGTWYTDQTRAHVENIVILSNSLELHLDPTTTPNPRIYNLGGLSVGDMILLVQMKISDGVPGGNFQELEVLSINGNIIEVEHTVTPFQTESTTNPQSRVQMIKLPKYQTVSLSNVIVRCHPWDGYTGGVLAYTAGETLLDNTIFTAAGCGFGPELNLPPTHTQGKGGDGGDGDNTYTNSSGGNPSIYERTCLDPSPSGANAVDGFLGEDGEDGGTAGSSGTAYTSVTHLAYGAPNYMGNKIVMGEAGYPENNAKGGDGGGGGGHGGNGGLSGDNNPGTNGSPGADGGDGGNASRGAKGGGIILIKTMYFGDLGSPSTQGSIKAWLDASGAQGENGRNGFVGGKPGEGGAGGQGSIVGTVVNFSGGGGGSGKSGTPSGGGDGSYAGKGGTIFIYTNPASASKPSSFEFAINGSFDNDWINLESGKNGYGGQGAFGYPNLNFPNIPYPSGISQSVDYDYCPPSNSVEAATFCDCDKAMYPFANVYSNSSSYSENGPSYLVQENNWSSTYDKSLGKLSTTDGTNTYICRFNTIEDAEIAFNAIYGKLKLDNTYSDFIKTRFNNFLDIGNVEIEIVGTEFWYKFKDEFTLQNCLHYYSNSTPNEEEKYIFFEFAESPYFNVKIDTSRCHKEFPDDDNLPKGITGSWPVYPTPPVSKSQHFGFNENVFLILPENDNPKASAQIMQSFDNHIIQIELIDSKQMNSPIVTNTTSQFLVIDLAGREVMNGNFEGNLHQINTQNMAKGVYVLRITSYSGMISSHKIVVN